MTTPSIVPTQYAGTDKDYLEVPGLRSGGLQLVAGAVSVPSGTAATTIVGLFPFEKGATFQAASGGSFYCADFGAGSTTVDIGIVYDNHTDNTNDVDLFVAASTAPQSGGFVTLTNNAFVDYVTTARGWVAATINTADADATANIEFNVGVSYGGKIVA